jgi:hypothetical protein
MTPSCSNAIYRTARRQHTCVECRATIQPGDVYEYVSGVWDGTPDSFKTCMACIDARNFYEGDCDSALFREVWDIGAYTFTQLEQDLMDFAVDCRPGTGLKFGAYRRAIEIRRRRDAARGQYNQGLAIKAAERGEV